MLLNNNFGNLLKFNMQNKDELIAFKTTLQISFTIPYNKPLNIQNNTIIRSLENIQYS